MSLSTTTKMLSLLMKHKKGFMSLYKEGWVLPSAKSICTLIKAIKAK